MAGAALTQLGRYRILAELGHGAMGVVYKAEDPLLNRTVAIKTIIMSADAAERAEYERRFYQEAKAAGGLNHPNVITIHDVGREGDIAYMAMELLEGVELREVMRRGPVALPLALEIAAQVADGLAFAHERGVVHRDIKPGNIMIVRDRRAKIMDFGIARMRVSDVRTQTGAILGSPKYMSPEQVAGRPADHRSDIFSLGVVLYELAAGAPPFTAPDMAQLMHQITSTAHRPPSSVNPSVPAMLDLIIAKALEKASDARYQSAAELAADLRACLAEVADRESVPPAAGDVTARLDAGTTGRAMVDLELAPTQLHDTAGVKTVKSGGIGGATDAGTHLPLSRKFDSSEALRRLTERTRSSDGVVEAQAASLAPSPGAQVILNRLWRDPVRRTFTAAVITAAVIALAIAFL
ncbi:MAG: serine/threonine protein kinase [Betaproteobacteria bacterium]|nr:serine/threonine protein kinase [Betaproteobacteria bacterium]